MKLQSSSKSTLKICNSNSKHFTNLHIKLQLFAEIAEISSESMFLLDHCYVFLVFF